jgi:hypothetical protein
MTDKPDKRSVGERQRATDPPVEPAPAEPLAPRPPLTPFPR